jgi:CheY-like chemotaxis protein/HPt (histidine-containing phosphotransfer) domain-containing protein
VPPKPVAVGSARILLVEDNSVNQQVAMSILRKQGHHVDAVANGAEALVSLANIPYDLVFMDVQMPVMDGFQATRQIRDTKSAVLNHSIPVVAMTANAMRGDREKCLDAGMDDYVAKPVTPHMLRQALAKWLPVLDASNPAASAAAAPVAPPSFAPKDAPVFDRKGMMSRLMGDEELALRVADAFLDDIPVQIAALKTDLKNNDLTSAERQAHTIKGASANLGGELLRAVAFELEKCCRSADTAHVAALEGELDRQFMLLKDALLRAFPSLNKTAC